MKPSKRIERLSADAHSASRALHPAVLDERGLEAALRDECDSFEQGSGISTQFTATNVPVRPPSRVALFLYRIAQESLRNLHKHSQSIHVKGMEGSLQGVTLYIEDAGTGSISTRP
jgi:signal transduction histidine kinase